MDVTQAAATAVPVKLSKATEPSQNEFGTPGGPSLATVINPSLAKVIDPSMARKLSDQEANSFSLALSGMKMPPPVDDLSLQYAILVKGGQTVATVYKDGVMMVPNNVPVPTNLINDGSGAEIAAERIKQMLNLLGGKIVYR